MQATDIPEYVAPRDALELQLVHIWEELLGRHPVGIRENFFQSGGDSVLAMSLLAQIVQDIGCPLPASGIFTAPTIEKLAAALRAGSSPETWSPLVPIQPQGSRRPFFCVHPGGGNVLCYLQLSRHLGDDQPVYGLQAPGVDGICPPLATIEEMAERYIAAIREVRPRGPYALGGWSVGGVVVYEMAQRLRAAGDEVSTLAIFDSGVLYACAILAKLFSYEEQGALDMMRGTSADRVAMFRQRTARAKLVPENADDQLAAQICGLFIGNMRAVFNYRPEPYTGRIDLFQAQEPIVKPRFLPYREWCRMCSDVQLHVAPGDHLSMMHQPHVASLAELLRPRLDA